MKSITEFANFTLNQGIKAKEALTAEGKTPEEIQASLGQTFKLEGDKLKYFINAIEVAAQNLENLKRVLVVSLAEGESVPSKSTKVEELHYVPEAHVKFQPASAQKTEEKGGRGKGGRRGGSGDKKGSPWGHTPEEKAAKGAAKAAAAAAAKAAKPS